MVITSRLPTGMLHGSLLLGKIFLTPSNSLLSHKIRDKSHKEEMPFILNGGATVHKVKVGMTVQN